MKRLNSRMGLFALFAALNLNTDGRSLLQNRRKPEEPKDESAKLTVSSVTVGGKEVAFVEGSLDLGSGPIPMKPDTTVQTRTRPKIARTRRERKARQLKKEKFLKSIRVVALPRNKKRETVRA